MGRSAEVVCLSSASQTDRRPHIGTDGPAGLAGEFGRSDGRTVQCGGAGGAVL